MERIEKNILIKFGNKKGDYYPALVDFSRFQEEFNIEHTSLLTRLEEHRFRNDNGN